MRKYILKGKEPVLCDNLMEFGHWYETADRRVALTEMDDYEVSTVFLGFDHGWGEGDPVLFETMVFGAEGDALIGTMRYSTWGEAEKGHAQVCEILQGAIARSHEACRETLAKLGFSSRSDD